MTRACGGSVRGDQLVRFVEGVRELPLLLESRQVTTVFQPIVSLPSGSVAGYEALGRGLHPRLPEQPLALFRVAAAVGAEAELSKLFRECALEMVKDYPSFPALFLNVHPSELESPLLVPDIVTLRERCPQLRLTLEVHEGALADLAGVDRLRTQLSRAGIGIAYDDFGAGQARLMELSEVPPDCLKFDRSLIHKISQAPVQRRQMLQMLVTYAHGLGVTTLAEGIENEDDADACTELGFDCGQGYCFGSPRAEHDIATEA